jgi:type IV pilus assembly protein PilC
MIVTPGQLNQRADFYYQLNQFTVAGLELVTALDQLQRNPPAASYREPIQLVLRQIAQGRTFTEALLGAGQWLPAFDITLIEAGEKSGRLDQSFRLLAGYYSDRALTARQFIADLTYPAILFHFAIIILAFLEFLGSGHWLLILLGAFLPVYTVTIFFVYAAQSKHGEAWRARVESVLDPLPLLGTGRRFLALSRLAAALEALISAGITIVEAWELAATASGSPALRRSVLGWKPLLNAGKTPAEIVKSSRCFPELFANQYATGEISGKLDETLRRLHAYYHDEGTRKLHAVAQWAPRMIYIVVLLLGGFIVIRFWMRHLQDIQNAGGF